MIKNITNLPTFGKLPIILFDYDDPLDVQLLIMSCIVASLLLMFNRYRQVAAVWLLYGWVCLFNRNPFISNPSLAYVGWILLTYIVIPKSEDKFPNILYHGLWTITALSYTVSGLHKLQCPSWKDGSALNHVLTSLLVRNNFIVSTLLSLPSIFLQMMTWTSLFAEISFLFLGLFKKLRKFYWLFFLFFHLGILATVNFSDLTFGMLVSHSYLFDARLFKTTKIKKIAKIAESDKAVHPPLEQNIKWVDWLTAGGISIVAIVLFATFMNSATKFSELFNRFRTLTIDSLTGFAFLAALLVALMVLERIFPDQKLEYVPGWWRWVIGINFFQLFAVIIATITWEKWLCETNYFKNTTDFHLRDHVDPIFGGIIAYLFNTWLFYWWHLLRHENQFLWITCHQFHHSAKRIETVTSFYKHPLEIVIDSQIMAILLYSILGLKQESSISLSICSAMGEYFYHMNIRTPQILGYLFQRPESHRCHHRRNKRLGCPNYSDFPLWDYLNDTFENPERMDEPTGFSSDKETMRFDMLFFKDVLQRSKPKHLLRTICYYLLVIWGVTSSVGFLTHTNLEKQTPALVSSPLPLVFSAYKGQETFATTFEINAKLDNGTYNKFLDLDMYSGLKGAYNRRNAYGAIFAFGPFFDDEKLINLRQEILRYAVCREGNIVKEFGIDRKVLELNVTVRSKTKDNNGVWNLFIRC
ncbi:MAG: desaturase [Harvfovirus sp.]|uniref:Desaturase n=1 Tax=Harvfovirus sp. TaxID=2487768 RepID=A0A3G5A1X8_9VIRU|nr:MAG: desaturase [Harvfovirus sp.]